MPRLIIRGQDGRPDRMFECEARVCTIGRSAENSLQIDDLNSSRHHCEVHEGKEGFELVDKDSRNGTFVNGRRVTRKGLVPGDKIEIGTTVLYFEKVPEDVAKARTGKETLDLSTGAFAPVDDPSGAKQRAMAIAGETGRIPPRDAVERAIRAGVPMPITMTQGASSTEAPASTPIEGTKHLDKEAADTGAQAIPTTTPSPDDSPSPRGSATGSLQLRATPAPASPGGSERALETQVVEEGDSHALAERVGELRRLLALNKTFNGELNVRRLLEKVMDTVIQVSGAERGFLILKETDPDAPPGAAAELRVKVSRNIDRESIKDARDKISGSIAREVIGKGQAVLSNDASHDPRWSGRESIYHLKLRSVLSVPLKHRDQVLGAIYLDNRFEPDRFNERVQDLLELVADQASIAIENARLFEENSRQKEELVRAKDELERLNQLLRDRVEKQDRELVRAREALAARREDVQLKYNYDSIITRSPKMIEVFTILDKVCESSVPVLIQGESGTGKELIARAIHYNGPRRSAEFVSENCAAIPQNLMESEFFGYVRGAFTGAHKDKKGLFEVADQGTLFLDEIGDMDLDMQTKLLRVLQDGVLRRVGSKEFKKVDVRIISATNRDLVGMIKEGKFREDLYYRLNVINVALPPLRERKEDVPLLIEFVLKRITDKKNAAPGQPAQVADKPSVHAREISPEALDILLRYDWPGNVRELENEIERSSALSKDMIRPEHLSKNVVEAALAPARTARAGKKVIQLTGQTLKDLVNKEVEEIERLAIAEVLQRVRYKKSKAASLLGISRPTLDAKIEKYNLSKDTVMEKGSPG
ncbi:sigma 54-interacting transcriptional regulator [bacterium]|nr:sigma 54-interacting transcriptional regulator [bacterium]